MSTTFGILNPNLPHIIDLEDIDNIDNIIEVAFRSNGIRWTNELAPLLPNSTRVFALDNTAQGIYTIGDLKKEINKLKKL